MTYSLKVRAYYSNCPGCTSDVNDVFTVEIKPDCSTSETITSIPINDFTYTFG